MSTLPLLSQTEIRVLATLLEKQRTVPDSYPMTLNALQAGCNQKSSRFPVLELSEPEILEAMDRLRSLGLVSEIFGSRVSRFEQHMETVLHVSSQISALLAVLMLRGPQTPGELRQNCERLYRFADISSVQAFLDDLTQRQPPLVRELPRAPGARENRWCHCLGEVPWVVESTSPSQSVALPVGEGAWEISDLREQLAALRARVEALEAERANFQPEPAAPSR